MLPYDFKEDIVGMFLAVASLAPKILTQAALNFFGCYDYYSGREIFEKINNSSLKMKTKENLYDYLNILNNSEDIDQAVSKYLKQYPQRKSLNDKFDYLKINQVQIPLGVNKDRLPNIHMLVLESWFKYKEYYLNILRLNVVHNGIVI